MGHQLTPVAVILVTAALVVLCGMEVRTLPVTMVVLLAAWVIYMATGYLAGHIAELVSPLSSPGGNVDQSVGQRIAGSDQHLLVVRLRLLATAALWLLAFAGAVRCVRRGRLELAMLAAVIPPFLLPALQPYGGEALLRVFFFALPPVAFLASGLVFPTTDAGRSRRAMVLAVGLTCVATVGFLFTRYGNERMDYVSPGDKAAVAFLYRTAPPGSVFIGGLRNIPWMYRDYDRNTYLSIQAFDTWEKTETDAAPLVREIATEHPEIGAYVIVTRGSIAEQHMLGAFPAGLLEKSTAALRRAPGVRVLYKKDGTTVLRIPGRESDAVASGSYRVLGVATVAASGQLHVLGFARSLVSSSSSMTSPRRTICGSTRSSGVDQLVVGPSGAFVKLSSSSKYARK